MQTINLFRYTPSFFTLLLAVLASGCTGGTTTTTPASTSTALNVLRALKDAYASTPNLALDGEMKISGVPANIWFDALIKRQDSMKIILTLPFGMPGGGMSATPDHFIFYDVREAAAVEGRPDRETFAKLMQVPLNYDEMVALFRGEIPRLPGEGEFTAVERDGYIVYTTSGPVSEEITVDPILPAVKTYARRRFNSNASGDEPTVIHELAISYDNFRQLGGRSFASRAVVNIMDGQQVINIRITKSSDVIPSDESLALDLPAGIERRRL